MVLPARQIFTHTHITFSLVQRRQQKKHTGIEIEREKKRELNTKIEGVFVCWAFSESLNNGKLNDIGSEGNYLESVYS